MDRIFIAETAIAPGCVGVVAAQEGGVKVGSGTPMGVYPADSMATIKQAGQAVNLTVSGTTKALAGAAVSQGSWLKATAVGKVVPVGAVAGSYECVGFALESAQAGEYFDMVVARTVITVVAA